MISRLKSLSGFLLFGMAMFSLGGIYVATLMVFPQIAYAVLGQ